MNSIKKKIAAAAMAAVIGVTGFSVPSFAEEALLRDSITIDYKASVAKPSYKIKGEKGKRRVKLTCSTSGVTIYYTTDGTTPTTSSKKYKGGLIVLKANKTLKAIAVKNGEKSSVMTKKIKVKTVLGDASGNGTIDEKDYTRLKQYINGKTSYVSTDNCDIDGNGKVNKTDLQMLRDYLDGEIEDFDDNANAIDIEKPEIVVYNAYGGKRYQITCGTKNAKIYYTTDGTTPTKDDTRYTGKFVVTEDTTVKAVAYLDGEYSDVKTRTVTVGDLEAPVADKSTATEYVDSVKVSLSCDNSKARILYTLDGSDPLRFGYIYKDPIELTKDTTIKAVVECKGYRNSKVVTYDYKVKSQRYTISGRVWDDSSLTSPDGVYQYGEKGIDGITVSLLNTVTNTYDKTTSTTTVNGVQGCYTFEDIKADAKYKVVFQYNGQKYRAYPTVVTNGNQAVPAELPQIVIKNGGAYNNTGALLANINSYASAIVSSFYAKTYATTTSIYNSKAENVNLALRSDVYGDLKLEFKETSVTDPATGVTSVASANRKIFANDIVNYKLVLTNNSPSYALNSSQLRFYIDNDLSIESIKLSDGTTANYSYEANNGTLGLKSYLIECSKIEKSKNLEFTIKTKTNASIKDGAEIVSFAEVVSYAYDNSSYDKSSIPGNFTGTVREHDEAASVRLVAYTSITSAQTISWTNGNDFTTPIPVKTSRVFKFKIENGSSLSDFNVYVSDPAVLSCIPTCTPTATGIDCMLVVTGTQAGSTNVVVILAKDSSKLIDANVTVA